MGNFTDSGYQKENLAEWKVKIETLMQGQFGEDVDLDPSGPFGQITAITSKLTADLDEIIEEIYLSRDPDAATGVSLDRIASETGTLRRGATATFIQDVLCYGDEGSPLEANSSRIGLNALFTPPLNLYFFLVDPIIITQSKTRSCLLSLDSVLEGAVFSLTINTILYSITAGALSTEESIIDELIALLPSVISGTRSDKELTLFSSVDFALTMVSNLNIEKLASAGNFQANLAEPITVPAYSLTEILTPLPGWSSIVNPAAGTTGTLIEEDPTLRLRRKKELISGNATETAIANSVSNVANVSAVSVSSNRTMVVNAAGQPPKSFEVVVSGGDDDAVAQAIFNSMPGGIEPFGVNASGEAYDSINNIYMTVAFSRPQSVYLWVHIERSPNPEEIYPSDGDDLVKQAIVDWAEEKWRQGADVIRQRLEIPVYSVDGTDDLFITIAKTVSPEDTPVYVSENISIAGNEIAEIITERITIVEIA